jgi:hypothetical protein
MNKPNPFADLSALRQAPGTIHLEEFRDKAADDPEPDKPARNRHWQRHYVEIPWAWMTRLRRARSQGTWCVAVLLLYEHWQHGSPVTASNILMQDLDVHRRMKSRALIELQELGLITVERKQRRSPRVTLKLLSKVSTPARRRRRSNMGHRRPKHGT